MNPKAELEKFMQEGFELFIRDVLPGENLKKISDVYEKSWQYAYKNIMPQNYLDSIPAGHWADHIHSGGRKNVVMTENGIIIGTSGFGRSRWEKYDNYGEIVSLYLLPEYIGKGYGRILLAKVRKELQFLGFSSVILWVLEENSRARNFYEQQGFTFTGESRTDDFGGKELRELLYRYPPDV